MATAEAADPHAHDADHDHPEWLAHHFETPAQQFDAGKLGIWLFLAQEVLFFSGLFVAYAVYRANHPEVFLNAHVYLNPTLGALNTIVLLASSLAVAWGVRAVMRDDQPTLLWMHIITLACAGLFMGVKVVEYAYKFDEGLYWAGWGETRGSHWAGGAATAVTHHPETGLHTDLFQFFIVSLLVGLVMAGYGWMRKTRAAARGWVFVGLGLTVVGMALGVVVANGIQQIEFESAHAGDAAHAEGAATPATDHGGVADHDENVSLDTTDSATGVETQAAPPPAVPGGRPANEGNFFSIYFAMTGVHALHILAGIGAISWIVARIARGDFGPARYGPVEYVGLYWHLVDLVWIYLFPLLYLIH